MIYTKQDLKEYLEADNSWYQPGSTKARIIDAAVLAPYRDLKRYLIYLRKYEYHYNNSRGSRFHTYLGYYYERRKNRLGRLLGIEIGPNCFGKGLSLWHGGNIVVNPNVRAGAYCTLHGGNCIGNNGKDNAVPVLGDHVDVGFGATLIGSIRIANHTVIGANAVVNHSVEEPGKTVAGVPAREIGGKHE